MRLLLTWLVAFLAARGTHTGCVATAKDQRLLQLRITVTVKYVKAKLPSVCGAAPPTAPGPDGAIDAMGSAACTP